MRVLLLEPAYRNKYPPIGLMKIAYFHRVMRGDEVFFAKGKLPNSFAPRKWDRIYVTSLFTFEYKATVEAIRYAQSLADEDTYIQVGGIAATLLPDLFEKDTGIRPCVGLLNEPGKMGLPGDECIDELPLDYSILEQIDYVYPFHDAYFLSATKGCGMRCGFCAVQRLEPTYIPYYDIKHKVRTIDEQFGPKKDLLLMDNNVLISKNFDQIIDDILELGFQRGATYINPKTGKEVRRYVDFNQGLDAKLITPEKAKRLGEIALSPARIAFDHIEDEKDYIRAIELCTEYGVTEMSNYLLYNSEDFRGKGNLYHADTPENMYARLRISLDLQTRLNESRPKDAERISIFSFPMRYIPLDATERGYIGSHWNAKQLRALQCMMIPTQGKGVGSVSFFEADFGKSSEEFVENLALPEKLMQKRGHFVERKGESPESREARYKEWERRMADIDGWRQLYSLLGEDRERFLEVIGDNNFVPEKLLALEKPIYQKLYYHYLTISRRFELLSLIDAESPTYCILDQYIRVEMPTLYTELLEDLASESTLKSPKKIQSFSRFFGEQGVKDFLSMLAKDDFADDALLLYCEKAFARTAEGFCDYALVRLYRRYVEMECLSETEHDNARSAICSLDNDTLRRILLDTFPALRSTVTMKLELETARKLLHDIQEKLFDKLQLSFFSMIED